MKKLTELEATLAFGLGQCESESGRASGVKSRRPENRWPTFFRDKLH